MNGKRTQDQDEKQIVVEIRRVTKVTKGGKNLNFRALVVTGDGRGSAGFGIGKASAVPNAIRKGFDHARKQIMKIPLDGSTIPHEVEAKMGASRIILNPASKGHGMVVGKTMRAFLQVAGIQDVIGKCIGSTNPVNVVNATVKALAKLKAREESGGETAPD